MPTKQDMNKRPRFSLDFGQKSAIFVFWLAPDQKFEKFENFVIFPLIRPNEV